MTRASRWREARIVLEEWRQVEGELRVARDGSPEAATLRAEASLLQERFQELLGVALDEGHDGLPPFSVV